MIKMALHFLCGPTTDRKPARHFVLTVRHFKQILPTKEIGFYPRVQD